MKGLALHGSTIEGFLEQVARRGSWFGGGSVAALGAAMAAALLEKLVTDAAAARRLKRIRRQCTALIDRDAATFSRVIAATRTGRRSDFAQALKRATEVPFQVYAGAHVVCAMGLAKRRTIKPRFQSDVRCALALAEAAARSADVLIRTNLAWLNDRAYAARMGARLRVARRPHAR